MFTFAGSFFSHFNHFFTIQSGIVLSHENLESKIPESMTFLITVVDEIIPKAPYIDISFRKIVLSVRFLIFDIIFTANKSLSCSKDRPNIFVSFNFTPNWYFAKLLSVSFANSFPSTYEVQNLLHEIFVLLYLLMKSPVQFSSTVIRLSTYRLSFISTTSAGYFSM